MGQTTHDLVHTQKKKKQKRKINLGEIGGRLEVTRKEGDLKMGTDKT